MQIAPQTPDNELIPPVNTDKSRAVWDKYGATFRHEIYIIGRNPVDPMHGYGNKVDFTEKLDRLEVLRGIIDRIWFQWQYRHKSDKMDIFVQTSTIRKEHPKILTLFPTSFTPYGELATQHAFNASLKRMYRPDTTIAGGFKTLADVFDPSKVAELEDQLRLKELAEEQRFHPVLAKDPLALVPVFPDHMALVNYCQYLSKNGVRPIGAVNAWYMKMVELHPTLYPEIQMKRYAPQNGNR
jgi:hypothetical protein